MVPDETMNSPDIRFDVTAPLLPQLSLLPLGYDYSQVSGRQEEDLPQDLWPVLLFDDEDSEDEEDMDDDENFDDMDDDFDDEDDDFDDDFDDEDDDYEDEDEDYDYEEDVDYDDFDE